MIRIGTSGWSYGHWVDVFYPSDLKRSEWLSHYAQHFDTVELNMSFYRHPFANMLKGWKKKLPENFKMTFKAHRQITHRKKFRDAGRDVRKFYSLVEQMGHQAGCILFQTPPSFHNTRENFETLGTFLEGLDPEKRNVMEFRHPSWWDEQTGKLLERYNAAFCNVSGLNMPPHVMNSSDFAYFRFHGPDEPYASKYSEQQLLVWADSIKRMIKDGGVGEVYCYFNNDFYGYALEDAHKLSCILQSM